jgi:hypothetical protein
MSICLEKEKDENVVSADLFFLFPFFKNGSGAYPPGPWPGGGWLTKESPSPLQSGSYSAGPLDWPIQLLTTLIPRGG